MLVLALAALVLVSGSPADRSAPIESPSEQPESGRRFIDSRLHQLDSLRQIQIRLDDVPFNVWVMDTPSKIAEGMMFLTDKDVKDNEGMIFVFSNAEERSFWMENTLIPLDIIFISPQRRVLNIVQGKPLDRTSLMSRGRAQYVVELKAGTAKKHKIGDGSVLTLPSSF
jgi:uncharacterized membrane protein (UPF0127 family)